MKKFLSLLLALAMILAFGACGTEPAEGSTPPDDGAAASDSPSNETPGNSTIDELNLATSDQTPNTTKSDETLTVVLASEPNSLITEDGSTNQGSFILNFLTDSFVNYDTVTHETSGALFEDWEWVDDTHLRAFIRQGVICYDGTEFNADDALWAIKHNAEKSANSYGAWFNVDNCVKEDEYTVVLEFLSPDPGLINALSEEGCVVIDQSSYEANGGDDGNRTNPLFGTGPYKFVEWVPGQYVLIERNEDYWDDSYVGYYKYIKFTFVSDTATRIMAVQSGDADIALDISIGQAIEFAGTAGVDMYAVDAEQSVGIWMNLDNPDSPLANRLVREAIRYAIDIEAVNQVFSGGYASLQPYLIKTTSPYFTDPTDGAGYPEPDIEKAKQLLEEAGYPGGGFTLRAPIQAEHEDLMTAVQAMLAEIGITVEITIPDTGTLVPALISGDYDLCAARHQSLSYFRAHSYFYCYEPAMSTTYLTGPKIREGTELGEELQGYIDTAYSTLDEDEAAEAIANIQQFMYDNCVIVNICSDLASGVCREGLIGFRTWTKEHIDITRVHPAGT